MNFKHKQKPICDVSSETRWLKWETPCRLLCLNIQCPVGGTFGRGIWNPMEVQPCWRKHIIWGWFIGSSHFQVSFSASHVTKCDQPSLGTCHHGVRLLPGRYTPMDSYPSVTTSQAKLLLLCIVLGHGVYQSHRKVTSVGEYWFSLNGISGIVWNSY